jgi:hypothetical protein
MLASIALTTRPGKIVRRGAPGAAVPEAVLTPCN